MKKILFYSAMSLLLFSCGGKEETTKEEIAPGAPVEETFAYYYENDSSKIKWTAYKFTEKAGVQGAFDSFEVNGTSESEDMKLVLEGATFSIETNSVQTNDTARNRKISESFFGAMLNTSVITGTIVKFSEDGSSVKLKIKMNDIEKEIDAPASWEGETVIVKTDINLEDWNGTEAINSLNKVCKTNHTGADGILKVWPDVSITIMTTFAKKKVNS